MELEVGSVVFSKAGRDKGKFMSVVGFREKQVLLCDGKERPLERPKLKSLRHIAVTGYKLSEADTGSNRRLKKALSKFNECCEKL